MTKSGYVTLLFLLVIDLIGAQSPFPYDLHLSVTPGHSSDVLIVAHGMGGSYKLAQSIPTTHTLVSFNFPDHDFRSGGDIRATTFGTIDELLPLLYVIRKSVITDGYSTINLYGFSAGGGAIINAIGVLNANRYSKKLEEIGISQKERKQLLDAIQKGIIILDTPLKSIQEIIAFRGSSAELECLAERYKKNDMNPIESLKYLKGLSLHVLVHFQNPDEILSNRDDDLFFETLKRYNANGSTKRVIGTDHGHAPPHPSLWNFYHREYNSAQ